MRYILIVIAIIGIGAAAAALRFLWELLQQNGRMLLRMEALEKRLKEIESTGGNLPARPSAAPASEPPDAKVDDAPGPKSDTDQTDIAPAAATDGASPENRFGNRSLAN